MPMTPRLGIVARLCAIAGFGLGAAGPPAIAAGEPRIEFNRDVRPILSDNCFACHGPDRNTREADLRLDDREAAIEFGAIVPGEPDDSLLVERVFATDPSEAMPPPKAHKTLTPAQKDLLKRWIKQGAEYQPHWAYIAPRRPEVPALADSGLVRNPIDAFVQETLADRKIAPAPEADRATLLRRLSLDLIGLPPTPEEVRAFVEDESPGAYEKQVDRLLSSPRYGERMAQHWLDLARYADTVGYHGDQNYNAWPYRDYVIDAFNANKPFDRFTTEQLAGDLLPNPTAEQRVATCFNRLNMMTREGGAQPKEYLAKYTADRIRTVSMTWLGSTFGCAECHDHKFDPISTKDFYSLGAFFADVKQWGVYHDYSYTPNPDLKGWSNDHPWPPEIVVESPALVRRLAKLDADAAEVAKSAAPKPEEFAAWEEGIRAFLKAHPDGWESPAPRASVAAIEPRKKPKQEAAEPPPVPAEPVVEADGRIIFAEGPANAAEIAVAPTSGWLAAVKVELLPDPKFKGRVARKGGAAAITPSFAVVSKEGKARALAIRHAQADRYAPRYANGFEVIGVQSGWTTVAEESDRPHTAVYVLDRPVRLAEGDSLQVKVPNCLIGSLRVSASPLAPADIGHPDRPVDWVAAFGDGAKASALYLRSTAWDPKAYDRIKAIDAEILGCRDGKSPVMVTERTEKPLTIRVLARGNWMDEKGEVCPPATPHFLPPAPGAGERELTRLDLAKWLCAPENPLTARVFANRAWRQFFGNGLSAQVDDLGAQGEPPSHPELLDWLAVEFRESGWDVKHLVRLIVTSHTYRQASGPRPDLRESDPGNRLLACQNPRRLEAEVVRDNALAIAGLLDEEMGGPPSKPYQPAGYYDGLQFPDRGYDAGRDERQYRRGVYTHWQRTFLHPMLANFDAPSREDCIAMRTGANSPQQALTLLNDPTFVEAARVWAAKLLAGPMDSDSGRIARAFEVALARPPKPKELASLGAFLDKAREAYRAAPGDAEKLLGIGIAPAPEDADRIELAAWTSLARVILNLHETITRY